MNALQIVNKVLVEKLGLASATTLVGAVSQTAIVLWAVNEVQRMLAKEYDWNRLKKQASITLVTAQDYYSLTGASAANDVDRLLNLYYARDFSISSGYPKINLVGDEQWLTDYAVNVTEGLPYMAREFGLNATTNLPQLQLYYIPTATYNGKLIYYDYIRTVTDLSADADTTPFADEWLIEGAHMKIQNRKGTLSDEEVQSFVNSIVTGIKNNTKRKRILPYRDVS